MMKLLIVGDPRGNHTLAATKRYPAESITVWEHPDNFYTLQQISDKITVTHFFDSNDMNFDRLIGNPPYDGGLYCDFMKIASDYLVEGGEFDLLLPSYTFTRKKSMKVCRDNIKLTSVDLTVGEHFRNVINGTWVARFRGTVGKTGNDEFDLTMTNGQTIKTRLSDINPTTQKFIKPNGMTSVDYGVVRKVLDGSIKFESHKETPIHNKSFCYLRPTLKYVAQPHPAAGSFNLHGVCNEWTPDVKNGWYIQTESDDVSESVFKIYTESKLFNFVNWLMVSDFPMVGKDYISMLPDVSGLTYKNESDLYEQFELTSDEIERIESIFP